MPRSRTEGGVTGVPKLQFHAVTEFDWLADYGHCFRGG
jgi:hypothetical protein